MTEDKLEQSDIVVGGKFTNNTEKYGGVRGRDS